jgi:glycosyltransferase involved in cell wall biosynthesis
MLKESKLLSIIIPHYNYGMKISKILDSIDKEQIEKQKLEILIIDDKSDSTKLRELRQISKKYSLDIKVIENETEYKGAGACRNIGIQSSNGKWVIFADCDDHFQKKFYNVVSSYFNSNFDMVYFPPISMDECGRVGKRHYTYLTYFKEYFDHKDEDFLRYSLTVIWSRMYKRSFLIKNDIKCDTDLISNDKMFALRAGLYANEICVDNRIIYSWDFNSKSMTTNMSKIKFLQVIDVFMKGNTFLKLHLSTYKYRKVRPSAIKCLAVPYIRYKLGLRFTLKILGILFENKSFYISINDFKKVGTFFMNNGYYSKNRGSIKL